MCETITWFEEEAEGGIEHRPSTRTDDDTLGADIEIISTGHPLGQTGSEHIQTRCRRVIRFARGYSRKHPFDQFIGNAELLR